jgi:hypothetical protein
MPVPTTTSSLTDAQIRARAGSSCECAGECGASHPRGRCRVGASGSPPLSPLRIHAGKQVCERCQELLFRKAVHALDGTGTLNWET